MIGPAFGGSQAVPSTKNESMFPRESTNAEQMIAVAGEDITSAGVEGAGTSQVPNTKDMIGPVCGGSQAMPSTKNESMLPRESTNAEQMIAVAGGESSGHNAAFVDGMNSLSLLPSKQPCAAASSGTNSRPISRIGSELEALITEHADEDSDISSIFDVGKAPTSHAMPSHSGISSYAVASVGAVNVPENTVAAHSGKRSFTAASFGASESMMAAQSGMSSFVVDSIGCCHCSCSITTFCPLN
ncbi:hypothetical protein HAX54_028915 [Datura stramonium]|uniref:Uncharacterized protein n=1 Tax=Datura stramonium TaxID=4076 RepID=A0ABS8V5U3_DATST|nr:hypothetical protein [Datura stramonium]